MRPFLLPPARCAGSPGFPSICCCLAFFPSGLPFLSCCCAFLSSGFAFLSGCRALFSSGFGVLAVCCAPFSSGFTGLSGCAFFSSWAGLTFCSSCWSCWSCCAYTGAAAPQVKDRTAVLITPTSFMGVASILDWIATYIGYCKRPIIVLRKAQCHHVDSVADRTRFSTHSAELRMTGVDLPRLSKIDHL